MVAETKSDPPVPDELAAAIESERRRADVAGAGVAAFDRNGLLFAGGFGYADLGRGEPVTPDTLFRAASITKLLTTTLILQEVEAGHISLSQSVNFYLDARARLRNKRGGQADDVTVQHLLARAGSRTSRHRWARGLQGGSRVRRGDSRALPCIARPRSISYAPQVGSTQELWEPAPPHATATAKSGSVATTSLTQLPSTRPSGPRVFASLF
jgi:hypothetical protein